MNIGRPKGPKNAKVLVVGEAFGVTEDETGFPFKGKSGELQEQIYADAGIDHRQCRFTNVVNARPPANDMETWFVNKTEAKKRGIQVYQGRYPLPIIHQGLEQLRQEIVATNPSIIIATGGHALWALLGEEGITKWRGSQLTTPHPETAEPIRCVPVYHPAKLFRTWGDKYITTHDLRTRVTPYIDTPWTPPAYNFEIRPSYSDAIEWLQFLLTKLSKEPTKIAHDLETHRGLKQIACSSFAWSSLDAFCIPFMCVEDTNGYWTMDQELEIIKLHRQILTHENSRIIGQNYEFDRQYIIRQWLCRAKLWFDTMTAQHTCWPGQRKSLDYISSMYARFHRFWKEERKEWDLSMDENQFWIYNCKDSAITWEVHLPLIETLNYLEVQQPFRRQMRLHTLSFEKTQRGMRIDLQERSRISNYLADMALERAGWFRKVVGYNVSSKSKKPWWNSPQQTASLFFDQIGVKPVIDRGTGARSTKSEHFETYGWREPILQPLLQRMEEYRSIQVFNNTFCKAGLDCGHMTSQYNVDGTETFRYSSSKNAFEEGTNNQNIPAGTED